MKEIDEDFTDDEIDDIILDVSFTFSLHEIINLDFSHRQILTSRIQLILTSG